MTHGPVLIEREGAVAHIVLNRPDAGNAIDVALARALHEAAIAVDADDAIRCVVIKGAGRMFCAGGDVRALHAAGDGIPALLTEITSHLHAAHVRLARLRKPVIVAVHRATAGAGCGLACIGDIVLALPTASFTLAYPTIGLSPDGGASWLLPRLIGMRRTQEWFLSNRRMTAEEAAAIGLITRVVAADGLDEEVRALATGLAAMPRAALGATKRLLLEGQHSGFEAQLEAEALAIAAQSGSREAREGLRAFADRRPAVFD
ncbi:enoyl-CoA hydratase/isomerase family protein [Sphingopyxis panaciterrae]